MDVKSREEHRLCRARGIERPPASRHDIHSRDRNLWHIAMKAENRRRRPAPLASTWQISRSPQDDPTREEQVTLAS